MQSSAITHCCPIIITCEGKAQLPLDTWGPPFALLFGERPSSWMPF
ncbi:Uncharacterized protein APZ42_015325 [Daphnia magna]|uniref:Uncharacterized protein n=1 Tax=Daphnia magna TaxID=35525 RepID=A0A162PCR5_9CRUS|nr:Uncharacterized protein APZ42_015325 [Daphnia magna]